MMRSILRPARVVARVAGLTALFGAGIPAASFADWQYTRWGMSVEEVVAASPAPPVKLDKRFQEQSRAFVSDGASAAMLAARHSETPYAFVAYFYFDLATGKLVSVNQDLRNMDRADQLLDHLIETYGQPRETSNLTPDFFARIWQADGNRIVFIRTPDTARLNFFAADE